MFNSEVFRVAVKAPWFAEASHRLQRFGGEKKGHLPMWDVSGRLRADQASGRDAQPGVGESELVRECGAHLQPRSAFLCFPQGQEDH